MASVSSAVGALEATESVEGAPVPEHRPEAHHLQVGVEGLLVVALPPGRHGGTLGGDGIHRGGQLLRRN
jgi:hypothetical protein